ncbi:hypothetical protein O6A27_21100 [Escherichia coli]|nr:hypothetical protein [Escherichia coli]
MSHITTEDPSYFTPALFLEEKLLLRYRAIWPSNILLDIGTLYLLKFLYRCSGAALAPGGGIIF